jgi:5-methyltetrahydropteroyltriglutamate--homocysteine methyltransferase
LPDKVIYYENIASDVYCWQPAETILARAARNAVVPWKLQNEELIEGKQDALRLSLAEQQLAGIDIVSDGEQTRQHFVTTFIEHLNGVDFEKRETVRIRNRYDASVPTVVGAVERQKPVFVEDAKFLRQLTQQPIKWALPGR